MSLGLSFIVFFLLECKMNCKKAYLATKLLIFQKLVKSKEINYLCKEISDKK